ncbi:condensation domain-containing protein [Streptomyces spongiae]|uniref:Condensation domain-containing protein n=1 Tax=Streptomyces spongiae TaxID=565072 RepID=A0A5N8XR99_9ACTN|nr:condensation domain-containing protein [Streptomyces spongiae]MPY61943.1 hypothetical protein [Streptomyces spongiae]
MARQAGNFQTVVHLVGVLDADRLHTAAQALLDRHTHLRTTPGGRVLDGVRLPWEVRDFTRLTIGERSEGLDRLLYEDRRTALEPGPLLRVTLVRLGWEHHDLLVTAHPALLDSESVRLLTEDLLRLYATCGDPGLLPRRYGFTGPVGPPAEPPDIGSVEAVLPPPVARQLPIRAAESGVPVEVLVQAAWAVVRAEEAGGRDVVLGVTVPGRPPDAGALLGPFARTAAVRAVWGPLDTAADLLVRLHRAPAVSAPYDTVVDCGPEPRPAPSAGGITVAAFRAFPDRPQALTVVADTGPGFRVRIEYHRTAFDDASARALAARLAHVLRHFAAEPHASLGRVDELSVLPSSLSRQLVNS